MFDIRQTVTMTNFLYTYPYLEMLKKREKPCGYRYLTGFVGDVVGKNFLYSNLKAKISNL